jgi:hypothetical protein
MAAPSNPIEFPYPSQEFLGVSHLDPTNDIEKSKINGQTSNYVSSVVGDKLSIVGISAGHRVTTPT